MSAGNDHVDALIEDHVRGRLSADAAQRVEMHCASCAACQAALEEAKQRHGVQTSLPDEASAEPLLAALERTAQQRLRRRRLFRRLLLGGVIGVALASAVLILMDRYYRSLRATPTNLAVYGHDNLLPGKQGSLHVLLTEDSRNHRLAGIPVTVELHRGEEVIKLAVVATDEHGIAQPQFQMPEVADGPCELWVQALMPTSEEHVHTSVFLRPRPNPPKVMLTTDRPVYEPGHAIEVRALALHTLDLHPLVAAPAVIHLVDPKGTVVFQDEVKTSRFGIAAAHWVLDKAIAEGIYTLECTLGGNRNRLGVEIGKYPVPKFQLDVHPDRPYYAPAEQAKLTVHARTFSGKPVAGAQVQVEVVADNPFNWSVKPVTARTNEQGQAVVTCPLPDRVPARPEGQRDAHVTFRVSVTGADGQRQTQSVHRSVTTQPARIEVIPEGKTVALGVRNHVYVFVIAADSTPVPATVTIEGWPGELHTDLLGLTSLDISVARPAAPSTFVATDAAGKEAARRTVQLECGSHLPDFLLRPDRAVYDAGQRMTLTAVGGEEPIFLEFLKDRQVLHTETVVMTGGQGGATIDLPPELFGTIEVRGVRFTADGYLHTRSRLLYIRPARAVKIHTTLDAAEYRPGGKAVVNYTLTDAAGKPAPGALSVAAVDAAVVGLLPQRPGQESWFFTADEKLLEPLRSIYPWTPEGSDPFLAEAQFAAAASDEFGGVGVLRSVHDKEIAVSAIKDPGQRMVEIGCFVLAAAVVVFIYLLMWLFARRNTSIIITSVTVLLVAGFLVLRSLGPRDPAGGQGGRAPRPVESPVDPHRVRGYFPETLLWKPELITDDQGRARLEIPLGESSTTWLLWASAITADGRLGAARQSIRVRQP
jgi:hypothetical protein